MRSRAIVIGTGILALILAACATSSPSTASSVHVVVSADDSVSRMVNTENIKALTEAALRVYAANAGEATLTISFTSLGVDDGTMPVMSRSTQDHRVPNASSNPPGEPSHPMLDGGTPRSIAAPRSVVKGTYTIADANGTILERKSIAILPDYRNAQTFRVDAHRELGRDVAKRVAALTTR